MTMHSASVVFVTGTDTGAGKTHVSAALVRAARARGVRACGFKPVAAGCERTPDGPRNADALALLAASGEGLTYAEVNPYALAAPVAPHLAAEAEGIEIRCERLDAALTPLVERHDLVVVEGAGGWFVPLNREQTFADWVSAHRWPVVLVVGLRLGCINHALLSAEAIERRAPLLGWVANTLPPPMPLAQANVEALHARLRAPLLGIAPCAEPMPATVGSALFEHLDAALGR